LGLREFIWLADSGVHVRGAIRRPSGARLIGIERLEALNLRA
jgi:hypothetical protein